MFVQPELEATLRRGVARFAQVRELLGHRLLRHERHAGGVRVELRLADSQSLQLSGRDLLACEGANSPIRLREQASVEELAFDEWWVVVDMWIRGPVDLRRWEMKLLPPFLGQGLCAAVRAALAQVSA